VALRVAGEASTCMYDAGDGTADGRRQTADGSHHFTATLGGLTREFIEAVMTGGSTFVFPHVSIANTF